MAQLESFRLKVFRAVAERLSFHKAAQDLFLTQPAVTLQIKALEADLGVRLLIVPIVESHSGSLAKRTVSGVHPGGSIPILSLTAS